MESTFFDIGENSKSQPNHKQRVSDGHRMSSRSFFVVLEIRKRQKVHHPVIALLRCEKHIRVKSSYVFESPVLSQKWWTRFCGYCLREAL